MLRIFHELTNRAEENIAIAIIKSFEEIYSGKIKILEHQKVLNNLISVIAKTINSDRYNKLKWKEQDEMTSIIIKAMQKLEKTSLNNAHEGEFRGAANIYQVIGLKILTREDYGWNYYNEWNELKFPDVFYDTKMQHILQTTISNAIKNTKYNTLFFNGLQLQENNENNSKAPRSAVSNPTPVFDLDQYAIELSKHGLLQLPSHSIVPSQTTVLNLGQYAAELSKYGLFQLPPINHESNQNNVEVPLNELGLV